MFEEIAFQGTPRRTIVVETRKRTSLQNFVSPAPGFQQIRFFEQLVRIHGSRWEARKPAVGGYNCTGMVWAARRTCLYDPIDWRRVLEDDGYRRLSVGERPELDDLAVYIKHDSDEILHVGRVCELRSMQLPGGISASPAVWVLSKWDPTSGESRHHIQDVYLNGGEEFDAQIWTDRPK